MTLKTIEQEWQVFSAKIFIGMESPPSAVQVEEMKRAFFAGAMVILVAAHRIGGPDISDADGLAYFEDRMSEAQQFCCDLIRRYAEGN